MRTPGAKTGRYVMKGKVAREFLDGPLSLLLLLQGVDNKTLWRVCLVYAWLLSFPQIKRKITGRDCLHFHEYQGPKNRRKKGANIQTQVLLHFTLKSAMHITMLSQSISICFIDIAVYFSKIHGQIKIQDIIWSNTFGAMKKINFREQTRTHLPIKKEDFYEE